MEFYNGDNLGNRIPYQFEDQNFNNTNDFINPFNDVKVDDFSGSMQPSAPNPEDAFGKFVNSGSSRETQTATKNFDWDKTRADRYVNSSYFKELGFDPNADNETKYGNRQTWGNVMSNAFVGGAKLAGQSFIQGWEGWGNLANALFNWDSNKSFSERLMGSPDELEEQNKKQEDVMNKYAIYSTPEDENGIFNKHFLGNMLQQGGMAVGATAQFLAEEFLTAGIASGFEGVKLGAAMVKFTGKALSAGEVTAAAVKVGAKVYQDENIVRGLLNSAKKLVPLSETAENIFKANKAGAGALQMAYIGAGGIKRALAEANMAFTQGRMLAAGTYGDLYGKLYQEYLDKNGQQPMGDDLDKIRNTAEKAATGDFYVNSGIQMVTNRIQFDALFNKFGYQRTVAKAALEQENKNLLSVTGKAAADVLGDDGKAAVKAGDPFTKLYEKGITGAAGKYGDIAKDFGAKTAAWEVTKDLGKGMFKWETTGGLHMLMQDITGKSLQDYYYDLYKDDKGFSGKKADLWNSVQKATDEELSSKGVQSFLMGALTGRLLSPFNSALEKVGSLASDHLAPAQFENTSSGPRQLSVKEIREQRKADRQETIDMVNKFFADPKKLLKEQVASFKVQTAAADKMDTAAKLQDQYYYNNAKDSAFAKMISAAKRTDMYESVLDTIKNYGDTFKDAGQFKEAFGLDKDEHNIQNVSAYFETIANKVKEHGRLYDKLMDKYGDLVQPDLYKSGSEGHLDALHAQEALHDAIDMLATNKYKAEQTVVRMEKLKADLGSNRAIGQSSARAVDVLGSEMKTRNEIDILQNEIKSLELNPKLDRETKTDLATKKEQLEALTKWRDGYKTFTELPREEQKAAQAPAEAYRDYLLAAHKENGLNPNVSEDDIRESWQGIVDHIQLQHDNGDYVDAFNTIANPKFFIESHRKMTEARKEVTNELLAEKLADILGKMGDLPEDVKDESPDDKGTDTKADEPQKLSKKEKQKLVDDAYETYKESVEDAGLKPMPKYAWFTSKNAKSLREKNGISEKDNLDLKPADKGSNVTPPAPEPVSVDETKPDADNTITKGGTRQNGDAENEHNIETAVNNQGNNEDGINKAISERYSDLFDDNNYKVIDGANSIGARMVNYKWTKDKLGRPVRERVEGENHEYPMMMATPAFNVGNRIYFEAEKDFQNYTEPPVPGKQAQKYTKEDFFNPDGSIKEDQKYNVPIAIYSEVNGKVYKLGHIHTMDWITARGKDGSAVNIAEESKYNKANMIQNVEDLRKIRDEFYINHNKSRNFDYRAEGSVTSKSGGMLMIGKEKRKLNTVLDSNSEFGVIRRGEVHVDKNITAEEKYPGKVISYFDPEGKEGWPVVMLTDAAGNKVASFVNVPKLTQPHIDLIRKGWEAFHTLNDTYLKKEGHEVVGSPAYESAHKLVQAMYSVYGNEIAKGESPDFTVLRKYVDDHITHLSSRKYATDIEKGRAFNIDQDGKIFGWKMDTGDKKMDQVEIAHPDKINDGKANRLNEVLSDHYYTVKFTDENTNGINSDKKSDFLSWENDRLKLTPGKYNDYISGILETNIDPGIKADPDDTNSPLVHFANPVVGFSMDGPARPANLEGNTATTDDQTENKATNTATSANKGTADDNNTTSAEPAGPGKTGDAPKTEVASKEKLSPAEIKRKLLSKNFGAQLSDSFDIPTGFINLDDYKSIRTQLDRDVQSNPELKRTCN